MSFSSPLLDLSQPLVGNPSYNLPFLIEAGALNSDVSQNIPVDLTVKLVITYPNGHIKEMSRTVHLDLRDIKNFYSRYTIDAPSQLKAVDFGYLEAAFLPDAVAIQDSQNLVTGERFFQSQDSIVFVHGWNMSEADKKAAADTMYKRLYWEGFQGKFYSFDWPTFYDAAGPWEEMPYVGYGANLTFAPSEYQAWRSGNALMNFLADRKTDSEHVYLLAHSMGNIVAAEALRLWASSHAGTPLVDTYVAMQAAISAGAYGDSDNDANVGVEYASDLLRSWSGGPPSSSYYMANARSAATHWVNMYNAEDYATSFAWVAHNRLKWLANNARLDVIWPWTYRLGMALDGTPHYYRVKTTWTLNPLFGPRRTEQVTELTAGIRNADGTPGRTAYEAIAFIAQANSRPVGTKGALSFSPTTYQVDLRQPGLITYKANEVFQHSFQFNNDYSSTHLFYERLHQFLWQ